MQSAACFYQIIKWQIWLNCPPCMAFDELSASLQAQAESAASCAMAAACMLQAIGSAMSRAQFWRSYIGPAMPHLITVLALIIPRQPQLAAKVAPPCSIQQWQSQALLASSCASQRRNMHVAIHNRVDWQVLRIHVTASPDDCSSSHLSQGAKGILFVSQGYLLCHRAPQNQKQTGKLYSALVPLAF